MFTISHHWRDERDSGAPCRKCNDRKPICHDTCASYIFWKARREVEKEESKVQEATLRKKKQRERQKKKKVSKRDYEEVTWAKASGDCVTYVDWDLVNKYK